MKTVEWAGGPQDGERFQVPDNGMSIDWPMGVVGEAFNPTTIDPSNLPKMRIARVPLVLTKKGWMASWKDREERIQ